MRNDTPIGTQLSWRPHLPPHYSAGAIEGRQLSLRNRYRTNQFFALWRAHQPPRE
ncbi:MAG: hypothetical protein HIU57_02215 [Acidobacteria bacterium]|nr:hypothetical protein [Acidobacteriota bacterium]